MWLWFLVAPFALLGAVNSLHGPSDHVSAETCTRMCHNPGCVHVESRYDWSQPIPAAARSVYFENIRLLGSTSLSYQDTNLVIYVLGFPSLAAVLLAIALVPTRGSRGRSHGRRWGLAGALWASVGICVAVMALNVGTLVRWNSLYWFCTDFCIHAANLMGITYVEFNFVLFVVLFPLTGLGLVVAALARISWAITCRISARSAASPSAG